MILIPEEYIEIESCVYKLWYGNKFLIIKGKTLDGSIYLFQKGYAYFLAGGDGTGHKQWEDKNNYYFKAYEYIKNNPGLKFRIELVLETNNGYQLLKTEQQELNKSFKDKNCLNNNIYAYIPKYRAKTASHGWIKKAHVLNFQKFLKML